ncbi:protein NRT1/ PTR FAMILY 2.7-like isoform X1 [Salvia splendens]|uniref:protein NRT1/ PTR FAMILY 2.7-like isoform X1 n=1 Tax=Salvia splendens TaxID=180675 RepID=UPI001C268AA2|nr:protein NRT1/ PTR FAMILY 2.7-like isoform X1 [Salvia splendens]
MESEAPSLLRRARGGWITFPFFIATGGLLALSSGLSVNLITFLKDEFHFEDASAAKITNYVNGTLAFIPIFAAIIADSFAGCFSVICFSSFISLLVCFNFLFLSPFFINHKKRKRSTFSRIMQGVVLLLLSATVSHLRPPSCEKGSIFCKHPTPLQAGLLYLSLALLSVGDGGTRFTLASMGADQLDTTKHQGIFFNWYLFTLYVANFVSVTVMVYVEEHLGWGWGFTIFTMANLIGLVVFLCGTKFYRFVKPTGSPFKSLACVIVAAIKKRKMSLSPQTGDYHHDGDGFNSPTPFFKFLNSAAVKSEEESSSKIVNPWKLCTVQQVEDLKRLIKIVPIWISGLILCIPIAVLMSFMIIQGKTMDNRLNSHFKIPVASIHLCSLIGTCVTIPLLDRLVFPLWVKLAPARPPTHLQRIGIGHIITIVSNIVAALVEAKRLREARSRDLRVVPMSLLWLAPQLAIVGVSEGFHFAGQVAFCYQEFPASFKTTATAVVALTVAGGYYSSNLVIDIVQSATEWLPNNINNGRLDNVYWLCSGIGALNLVFYLVCASSYKYHKS